MASNGGAAASARSNVFAPLRAANASELIVRRIGEAIGGGVLAPGEQLPSELDLAAMLAVAPMTLRQAIAILREAGLVETRRGKHGGSFVAHDVLDALAARDHVVDRRSLREMTDWRRAVSGEAAALAAARAGDVQRVEVERLAIEVRRRAADGFADFRLADSRLHLAIAAASTSPRMVEAETAVQAELGLTLASIPAPVRARRASAGGHDPIVRAIQDRHPDAAREAMVRHVEATHDWVVGLGVAAGRRRPGAGSRPRRTSAPPTARSR